MIEIDNILEVEKLIDGLEAIIFDLDDTLYSEKSYVRSGYKAVAAIFPEVENMEDKLWDVFQHSEKAIDDVLKAEGILTSENKERALKAYRYQKPEIGLYPGIKVMLDRIKKKKKFGIITDGRPEGQRAKLEALKLDVGEVIITDELGGPEFRKPNERAFRLMQERMHVPFEKMVYIGDNLKKDFIAPEKLGMRCIYFRNPEGLYPAFPTIVTI